MLTDPADPSRVLLELGDLDHGPYRDHEHGRALRHIVAWAREYLCRPHPELGRNGPVCPYVQTSLDRGAFLMALCPGTPTAAQAAAFLAGYRDWFVGLAPPDGVAPQFRTVLALFPDLLDTKVVDEAQRLLKDDYVRDGLMIGEFHPGPPGKSGLWNQDFLPLASPVPLLAIRQMVASDFPFLRDDPVHERAYRERFGDRIPARYGA